jgi:hypothetical protein
MFSSPSKTRKTSSKEGDFPAVKIERTPESRKSADDESPAKKVKTEQPDEWQDTERAIAESLKTAEQEQQRILSQVKTPAKKASGQRSITEFFTR